MCIHTHIVNMYTQNGSSSEPECTGIQLSPSEVQLCVVTAWCARNIHI